MLLIILHVPHGVWIFHVDLSGSILGPLLFLPYVNDLQLATNTLEVIMFADDTNLFISGKDIKYIFSKMNRELIKINKWFCA